MHNNVQNWSTSSYTNNEKLDAWQDMISVSHLPWTLSKASKDDFNAKLAYRLFDKYRIIKCECDAQEGFRSIKEISDSDNAYLNLLYVRKGSEQLKFDDRSLWLNEGDMVIWDSTQHMSFHVPDKLEKVSLLIPESSLTSVFPTAHDYRGIVIPKKSGVGSMLANHINNIEQHMWQLTTEDLTAMMEPTMSIMAAAFGSYANISPNTMRHIALNRIKQFIISNLHDPDLNPTMIASAHNITPRYLHMLFEDQDTTVSTWIKSRRLDRSKDDLIKSIVTHQSVSEIAFKWGFNDLSHFSRIFKQRFGQSPRGIINAIKMEIMAQ